MIRIIKDAFASMVDEIENSVTGNVQPHRYHETSVLSEINSVYHFVKYFEKKYGPKCCVYLEYPCDSGRVDGVIVLPHDLILIEAKSEMEIKKFHELNAQAIRFENLGNDSMSFGEINVHMKKYAEDSSLRKYLKSYIEKFVSEKWKIENPQLTIWGVLLGETTKNVNYHRWIREEGECMIKLESEFRTLASYTRMAALNKIYKHENREWWHLLGYKNIGEL